MPRRPPRDLTGEEEQLWEQATRDARPLAGKKFIPKKSPPPVVPSLRGAGGDAAIQSAAKAGLLRSARNDGIKQETSLSPGAYAGIDKNTARKFTRGEYPIDASLDLHGMTRERAHIALNNFIRSHYEQGSRGLLIITGKGEKGQGVIRYELPHWLNAGDIRPLIVAFNPAKPHHGGQGAFYVLLRRKR